MNSAPASTGTSLSRPHISGFQEQHSNLDPAYVVWVSDTHCGHSAAIVNPSLEISYINLLGEWLVWKPQLNPAQEFLWVLYEECLKVVGEIIGTDPLIVLHGGDVCHGNKHPDGLMTSQRDWQVEVGMSVIDPWFQRFPNNLKVFRIALGTEAHNWGEGALEMILLRQLQERYPAYDIRPALHGLAEVNGLVVDYAHHGPGPGIREWTDGNQLRYYMRSMIIGDQRRGRKPPGLILRGHFHDFTWETDHYIDADNEVKTTHAFITPSWCAMNFYGTRATKSQSNQDFGMLLFKIVDGEVVQTWPLVTFVDLRTKENWL